MEKVYIAPSILAADFGNLGAEIKSVEQGGAEWLHIDVMDGTFVPPITFGDNMVKLAKRSCKLVLDVHLMIVEPERHFHDLKAAGADRITIHQETCPHLHRSLAEIRSLGMKSGVAINPGTPVEAIYSVLEVVDLVLVMTVNPGWGGQSFIPSSLEKIKRLRAEIDRQRLPTIIQVDGGIKSDTAKQCVEAGVTSLVAGSSVFGSKDRTAAIAALR